MAQSVLYGPMRRWLSGTWRCFVASLGDGVIRQNDDRRTEGGGEERVDRRQKWIEANSRAEVSPKAAQVARVTADQFHELLSPTSRFCGRLDYPSRRGSVDESGQRIVVGWRATNRRTRWPT